MRIGHGEPGKRLEGRSGFGPRERAALAEQLLASLDELGDGEGLDEAEVERLWVDEAQRRLEAYRAGRTIPVPAEQVHARAEKLLR
ncbi:MAG TPA: addiction module protein [Bryobacteraceae bacterium]|nr:addiction module protein [Bryobacteraceae bacterium]